MTMAAIVPRIVAVSGHRDRRKGTLLAGPVHAGCAFGRSGTRRTKIEGDGATPVGTFGLVAILYRPDRMPRPHTRLPVNPITPFAGWCDDPADPAYNREVRLPYAARHERLWREDHLYDVIVVLDYNLARPMRGKGSAIFLHIAGKGLPPTEGCVAVEPETMARLLPHLGAATVIDIR